MGGNLIGGSCDPRLKMRRKFIFDDNAPTINFGDLITRAKGGDLILVEDLVKFDNYTLVNS